MTARARMRRSNHNQRGFTMTRLQSTRRRFLAGAAGATAMLAAPSVVRAQAKEIVVGGPGGMAGVMRDFVVPDFEKKLGCKVLYEGSRSAVNLQKLQTDKANPKMSV